MNDRTNDESQIRSALCRYARAIDRGQWQLLHSVFHPDGIIDHGPQQGGVDGFIHWLQATFADERPTVHFLGNCLFEFAGPDRALVESYFTAIRPPRDAEFDAMGGAGKYVQSWGRYVDRFERRGGEWRIAHRCTVIDLRTLATVHGGAGTDASTWGRRDMSDPLHVAQAEMSVFESPQST